MMFRRLSQIGLVIAVVFLVLPSPALGGSPHDPEILSRPNTTAVLRGEVIPHLEVTKGWIQPTEGRGGDRFKFILEIASLPPMEDIPKDSVYVFHYTIGELGRLYFRANWTSDHTRFEFLAGLYAGCMPGVCPPYDEQGNRNYRYIAGNSTQSDYMGGEVIPGAPGRIVWSYPQEAFSVNGRALNGLEIKSLFAATYTITEDGALRYADITMGVRDYIHTVQTPWHQKLLAQIPGPSPLLLVAAALGVIAAVGRHRRPPGGKAAPDAAGKALQNTH